MKYKDIGSDEEMLNGHLTTCLPFRTKDKKAGILHMLEVKGEKKLKEKLKQKSFQNTDQACS